MPHEPDPSSDVEAASHFAELPADLQARIDDLCDQFEAACKSGVLPVLEEFLADCDSRERAAVLRELVPLEIAYRQRHGETAFAGDYQRRFPELDASWLDAVLGTATEIGEQPTENSEPLTKPASVFVPPSIEAFLGYVAESQLLRREEAQRILNEAPLEKRQDSMAAARWFVERDALTKFQAQMLLRGKPKGLVLGDCVVLDLLGRGGMGAVYRAWHRRMERLVAIKVLPPSAARDRQLADRFRREVKAAARLSHPNIVAAYDAGEQHGILYLVMEFVEGQNLAAWIKMRGAMAVAHAVEVVRQAADGLAYAHEQGVIHRDIKPSNLMIESRDGGTIKVLDMGLARLGNDAPADSNAVTGITRSGMLIGTAEYMAPEQAINVKQVDQRADIYSLGATLYFLLVGRHMYSGNSFLEIVMAHQMLPVPSLRVHRADIPPELEQLFHRLVAKRADDRPQSMREVVAALDRIRDRDLPSGEPQWRTAPLRSSTERGSMTEEFSITEDDEDLLSHEPASANALTLDASSADRLASVTTDAARKTARQGRNGDQLFPATYRFRARAVIAVATLLVLGVWVRGAFFPSHTGKPGGATVNQTDRSGAGVELASVPFAGAREHQLAVAKSLGLDVSMRNSIGMTLQLIPPGEFLMGLSDSEFRELQSLADSHVGPGGLASERPQHRVRLTQAYWMGRTEVTVAEFRKFVSDTRYETDAENTGGWGMENGNWVQSRSYCWKNLGDHPVVDDMPAVSTSYRDAVAFCEWLSKHERQTYRLPTEAEWEFACRAGQGGIWPTTLRNASIDEVAWYIGNSGGRIHNVASRPASNGFGLFDMLGNESEWCLDAFDPEYYRRSPIDNPQGPTSGDLRVQRGGMFGFQSNQLRFTARDAHPANSPTHGAFRVVCEIK